MQLGRYILTSFVLTIFLFSETDGQIIQTIAGGGTSFSDNIPATAANVRLPVSGAVDAHGNYYFSEAISSPIIRKILSDGSIVTIAGDGTAGFYGDGGPATAARLNYPVAVAVDTSNNVYIADRSNARIRKVNGVSGLITTFAGNGNRVSSGDGGLATAASFVPENVCVDLFGNVYILDSSSKVRKVSASGIITTVAGTGATGFSGDGGLATAAQLSIAYGLCTDQVGYLYIGCKGRVRKVNLTTGIITTIAGNGNQLYIGDGMRADSAQFDPYSLNVDVLGNLFIGDVGNDRIYMVSSDLIFQRVAGTGIEGFSGDDGQAIMSQIYNPEGLASDSCGNIYIADDANHRIRKVSFNPACWPATVLETKENKLSIYPNPVEDELHIDGLSTTAEYVILNMTGIIEQKGELKKCSNNITVKMLQIGVHLLVLTDDDGKRTIAKIIKQ